MEIENLLEDTAKRMGESFADATFIKFLKRYLGIPFHANNSITHFLTSTVPLTTTLKTLQHTGLNAFTMPPEMNGYMLSFLNNLNPDTHYDPLPIIPTYFWRSRVFFRLPNCFHNRKKLCHEIYDITHLNICSNEKFHILSNESCICRACGENMSHYSCGYYRHIPRYSFVIICFYSYLLFLQTDYFAFSSGSI